MALKSREKILIIFVLVAVSIWAFDRFFYVPRQKEILSLYEAPGQVQQPPPDENDIPNPPGRKKLACGREKGSRSPSVQESHDPDGSPFHLRRPGNLLAGD